MFHSPDDVRSQCGKLATSLIFVHVAESDGAARSLKFHSIRHARRVNLTPRRASRRRAGISHDALVMKGYLRRAEDRKAMHRNAMLCGRAIDRPSAKQFTALPASYWHSNC
jgi:hypothetical protein